MENAKTNKPAVKAEKVDKAPAKVEKVLADANIYKGRLPGKKEEVLVKAIEVDGETHIAEISLEDAAKEVKLKEVITESFTEAEPKKPAKANFGNEEKRKAILTLLKDNPVVLDTKAYGRVSILKYDSKSDKASIRLSGNANEMKEVKLSELL